MIQKRFTLDARVAQIGALTVEVLTLRCGIGSFVVRLLGQDGERLAAVALLLGPASVILAPTWLLVLSVWISPVCIA